MIHRRFAGGASELHRRPIGDPETVEMWSFSITGSAIVLGPRQSEEILDVDACTARGVEIVRRRSGGGAVLLEPGAIEWVDIVVPVHAAWWTDDVIEALVRGGHVWLDALRAVGVAGSAVVHEGRLRRDRIADEVCFAGLGAGEVTDEHGAKLVGLSQRRTREGARLQGLVHRRWNPALLGELLAPGLLSTDDIDSIAVAAVDVGTAALITALEQSLAAALEATTPGG